MDPLSIFAVFSVWGNQWLKLCMFAEDWSSDIDVLLSAYDMLCGGPGRLSLLTGHGLRFGINETRRRYAQYLRSQSHEFSYYREYSDLCQGDKEFTNHFLIDSGGFGLTAAFEDATEPDLAPELRPLFHAWKKHPERAQRIILSLQMSLRPNAIITLDKVIKPTDPASVKSRKVEFSLKCAKEALQAKSAGQLRRVKLFGALHGYGPRRNGRVMTRDLNFYRQTTCNYAMRLLELEDSIGSRFDGFSVGSLVPISSPKIIETIASSARETLERNNRFGPLHALGTSTANKVEMLTRYGFSIFDTNVHVKKARNRQIFHPKRQEYASLYGVNGKEWACECNVCSHHGWKRLNESRQGMKEVSTVLVALHNFLTDQIPMAHRISDNMHHDVAPL